MHRACSSDIRAILNTVSMSDRIPLDILLSLTYMYQWIEQIKVINVYHIHDSSNLFILYLGQQAQAQ